MLNPTGDPKMLLFEYAVLSARLKIREFFLKHAVKDVYENIGQVLSLVRMQLASFNTLESMEKSVYIVQSGNLVGQSIKDLRSMCRSFYPDDDILKEGGFTECLETTLSILQHNNQSSIRVQGNDKEIPGEIKLIGFELLLDILIAISKAGGIYNNLVISYTQENIILNIGYIGEVAGLEKPDFAIEDNNGLAIQQRIEIVSGEMYFKKDKTGISSVILNIPLNPAL